MHKIVDGISVALTEEEISEFNQKKADWEDKAVDRMSEQVRSKRNGLLSETDWWASSDLTMTAEQKAYRQALRDITNQPGFPHEITWPVKPGVTSND